MPNRCNNNVKIVTKRDTDIQEIISAIKGEGLFQHFIPRTDEVRKDRILESIFGWCNGEEIKAKLGIPKGERGLDRKEMGFKECPYKQLWHDWQRENWGSKWDFNEGENREPDCQDVHLIEFSYESAWSPHLKGWKKLSDILQCRIEIAFDEPGCEFSGEYIYENGECIESIDYDDGYYGNGKECCICKGKYDNSNPDDRGDEHHTVCIYCWEDLDNKQRKKGK